MTAKEKCEYLRQVRKEFAERNGIEYTPESCSHNGTCKGYCPKCDEEAAFLLQEFEKKKGGGSTIHHFMKSIIGLVENERRKLNDDDKMGEFIPDNIEPLKKHNKHSKFYSPLQGDPDEDY